MDKKSKGKNMLCHPYISMDLSDFSNDSLLNPKFGPVRFNS